MNSQVEVEKKKALWYRKLLEDLKKLIKAESSSVIPIKHSIGKRILAEKENVPYGQIFAFIKDLASELEYSWQDLYFCAKFAEKYPDFEAFLKFSNTLENPTWHYITERLPYQHEETDQKTEEKFFKCGCCEDTLPSEDSKTIKLCSTCSADFLVFLAERKEQSARVQEPT